MRKFIVNVVEKKVFPIVVEANDEWQAMERVADGEGKLHSSGSLDITQSPMDWEIEEYMDDTYPVYSHQFLMEFM